MLYFDKVHQVAAPVGCSLVEFIRMRHWERSLLSAIALLLLTFFVLTDATVQ